MIRDTLVDGTAIGPLLVLTEPLSFWGGVDVDTGTIIDRSHPEFGESVAGAILAMPHGRGSSSAATVLAETIRIGTGPAGVLLSESDSIIVTGVFVANALYGKTVPVFVGPLPASSGDRFILDSGGCRPVTFD